MVKNQKPLISIITVTLNAQDLIEDTITSVIGQTAKNYEYLIVDGGSDDGTTSVIEKYNKFIDYFCSEDDEGIYDAMNKGIEKSQGEYIFFLNAGDSFFDAQVIEDISLILKRDKPDILYGQVSCYDKEYQATQLRGGKLILDDLKKGEGVYHQSVFAKNDLIKHFGGFDIKYSLASDFDMLCKFFSSGKKDLYFHCPISNYLIGGASSDFRTLFAEKAKIIKKHFGTKYYVLFKVKKFFVLLVFNIFRVLGLLPVYYRLKYF